MFKRTKAGREAYIFGVDEVNITFKDTKHRGKRKKIQSIRI